MRTLLAALTALMLLVTALQTMSTLVIE